MCFFGTVAYIQATPPVGHRRGVHAFYDVYHVDGGPQLGTVERRYGTWIARAVNGSERASDARWKATTALWGLA